MSTPEVPMDALRYIANHHGAFQGDAVEKIRAYVRAVDEAEPDAKLAWTIAVASGEGRGITREKYAIQYPSLWQARLAEARAARAHIEAEAKR